ncbi:MAG: ABC-2 family transporter protein [Pelotomaculum sp. PtaB.Bin104]|nr:MAG: ABC-2 family transporter protein [Pelotomaculum sp. PtaB.Bin104]
MTVLLAAIFLALYGTGVHYGYQEMSRNAGQLKALIAPQFLALGLYFGSFIISFLAVMAAVGTISGEIESGVLHAIVPGPVRRSSILLGKFFGYGLMLAVFAALFYLAVMLIIHFNTGLIVPLKIGSAALYCLQPLILLAVAMLGSTFLSTLANGVGSFMLYSIGVAGGMLEQIGYLASSHVLVDIGIFSSLLMPADAIYRKIVYSLLSVPGASFSTSLLGPFGSSTEPSVWMLVYTGFYILGFLFLAIRVFSRRDI